MKGAPFPLRTLVTAVAADQSDAAAETEKSGWVVARGARQGTRNRADRRMDSAGAVEGIFAVEGESRRDLATGAASAGEAIWEPDAAAAAAADGGGRT